MTIIYFILWIILMNYSAQEKLVSFIDSKVFGGRTAGKGEFPFVASVWGDMMGYCGSTIVTLNKVVTAGHCVTDRTTDIARPVTTYTIYGGTTKILNNARVMTDKDAQKRDVLKIRVHEKYSKKVSDGSHYHDIALIELKEPFVLSDTLKVARFPAKDEKSFFKAWEDLTSAGKTCTGVGWGTTALTAEGKPDKYSRADDLQVVTLTPLAPKECKKIVLPNEDMTSKGEVCLLSEASKGQSMCTGDSGSPLICDGYVFAVARSVSACGVEAKHHFYTLYAPYIDYYGLASEISFSVSSLHLTPWLFLSSLLLVFF